jgi:hypothetical protein
LNIFLLSVCDKYDPKMKMAVFWDAVPCGLSDDGGSKYLRNMAKLLPVYTALQPRRQPYSFSPP